MTCMLRFSIEKVELNLSSLEAELKGMLKEQSEFSCISKWPFRNINSTSLLHERMLSEWENAQENNAGNAALMLLHELTVTSSISKMPAMVHKIVFQWKLITLCYKWWQRLNIASFMKFHSTNIAKQIREGFWTVDVRLTFACLGLGTKFRSETSTIIFLFSTESTMEKPKTVELCYDNWSVSTYFASCFSVSLKQNIVHHSGGTDVKKYIYIYHAPAYSLSW